VSPLFNERAHITGSHSYETDVWQLFDLTNDFSESTDLSAQYPERVRELESLWIEQATANNVFPLFDPAAGYPAHPGEYPLPRSATYQPSDHPIAAGRVPSMFGGFTMSAIVICPATENGIIAALGDHQGGWTLRLDHGTPHFDVVYGHQRAHLVGTNKISAGTHQLTVTMKAGALALFVNDEQVANGHFGGLFMFPGVTTAAGGMWIGRHEGLPIVDSYSCPNDFTGNITSVTVSSGSPSSGPSLATTMRIAEGAD
jgi:arylsulfatase